MPGRLHLRFKARAVHKFLRLSCMCLVQLWVLVFSIQFAVTDAVMWALSTSATNPQGHQGIQRSGQSKLSHINIKQVGIGNGMSGHYLYVPPARLVKVRGWC